MAEPFYVPTGVPFHLDDDFSVWETSPGHYLVAVRNGAATYRTNDLLSVARWMVTHQKGTTK